MSAPYQLLAPLRDEEYAALKADIAAHGVQVPVELDEAGVVIDGHHRVEIAAELAIDYPRHVVPGLSDADKRERALKLNLLRRHLGPIAWAEAFRKLADERGIRLGKQGRQKTDTVSVLAAELGVDVRTARRRLKVAEDLAEHSDLHAAIDQGGKEAQRAYRIIRDRAAQQRREEPAAYPREVTTDLRSKSDLVIARVRRDPRVYWLFDQRNRAAHRTWQGVPRCYRVPDYVPPEIRDLPGVDELLSGLVTSTKEAERLVTAAKREADRLISDATAPITRLIEDLDRPHQEARRTQGLYVERAWKASAPLTSEEFEHVVVPMVRAIEWTRIGFEVEPEIAAFTIRSDASAGVHDLATWHLLERDGSAPDGYGRWSVCWQDGEGRGYHRRDFWHPSSAYCPLPSVMEAAACALAPAEAAA